jgi:hypothetical protein
VYTPPPTPSYNAVLESLVDTPRFET